MIQRVFLPLLLVFVTTASIAEDAREIKWQELIPKGWDPQELFEQYSAEQYAALSDAEYMALQEKAQEMLVKSPLIEALDGEKVRIPGFVVPLEYQNSEVSEFLLVPYFGACMHTPPPPANQIIKGALQGGFELSGINRPVWITGKLQTGLINSEFGGSDNPLVTSIDSGYSMDVEMIEPYRE